MIGRRPEIAGVVVCGVADNLSLTSTGLGLMIFFFLSPDLRVPKRRFLYMLFSGVGEKYPFPTHRHRMRAELAGNVWGVGGVG